MPRTPWLILLLLLPAACAVPHITQPPGPWSGYPEPNDWNLHVMAANPQDLSYGQAANGSVAREAVPPLRLMFNGQRTALINWSSQSVVPGGTGPAGTGGAGATGQQQ